MQAKSRGELALFRLRKPVKSVIECGNEFFVGIIRKRFHEEELIEHGAKVCHGVGPVHSAKLAGGPTRIVGNMEFEIVMNDCLSVVIKNLSF